MDERLEVIGSIRALDQALEGSPPGATPIHQPDRGSQYCCHEYVQRIGEANLSMSMTEEDHCAENAMAERVNGILKQEYGLGRRIPTKAQARAMADHAVHLYNTHRPHRALNMEYGRWLDVANSAVDTTLTFVRFPARFSRIPRSKISRY